MKTWQDCYELLRPKWLARTTFNVDDILPDLRSLELPWNHRDSALKTYFKRQLKQWAAAEGIEISFGGRNDVLYPDVAEHQIRIQRMAEAQVRGRARQLLKLRALRVRRGKVSRRPGPGQMIIEILPNSEVVGIREYRPEEALQAELGVPVSELPFTDDFWTAIQDEIYASDDHGIRPFPSVMAAVIQRPWSVDVLEAVFTDEGRAACLDEYERIALIATDQAARLKNGESDESGESGASA